MSATGDSSRHQLQDEAEQLLALAGARAGTQFVHQDQRARIGALEQHADALEFGAQAAFGLFGAGGL
jgi:hypothetical protein